MADSAGEVYPIGISFLYGSCNGVTPEPFLEQASKLGFEYGRSFSGRITERNGIVQSAGQGADRVRRTSELLRKYGMFSQSCFITDSRGGNYSLIQQVQKCAQGLLPGDFGEIMNEIGHPTQERVSWEELFDLANVAREAGFHGPLGLGADLNFDELDKPADQGGKYHPAKFNIGKQIAYVHLNRDKKPEWREVGRLNELRVIMQHHNVAGSNNEPGRADHETVTRPEVYSYLMGATGTGMMFANVFHASQPRDCQVMTDRTLAAAKAFLRGAKVMPRGRYHFENGHWANSPVARAAFAEGEGNYVIPGIRSIWRVHSYRHEGTGQWFMIVSGEDVSNEGHVELKNGWSRDQLIDKMANNVVVYTLKRA